MKIGVWVYWSQQTVGRFVGEHLCLIAQFSSHLNEHGYAWSIWSVANHDIYPFVRSDQSVLEVCPFFGNLIYPHIEIVCLKLLPRHLTEAFCIWSLWNEDVHDIIFWGPGRGVMFLFDFSYIYTDTNLYSLNVRDMEKVFLLIFFHRFQSIFTWFFVMHISMPHFWERLLLVAIGKRTFIFLSIWLQFER